MPRDLHRTAAKLGLLGIGFPEEVGGSGGDLLDVVAVTEELIGAGGSSGLVAALFTHGIALPHIVGGRGRRTTLIDRYVRPTLAGEMIGSLAITEPDGGSDVAAIRTTARRDGDHYVVNGTQDLHHQRGTGRLRHHGGAHRTGPGRPAISLLVIDKGTPGFTVGRRLEKLGWHCSDTAELSFVDVRVPRGQPRRRGDRASRRSCSTSPPSGSRWRCTRTRRRSAASTSRWPGAATGRRSADRLPAGSWFATGSPRWPRRSTPPAHMSTRTAIRVASGETLVTEVAMAKNIAVAACDDVVDQAVQLHGGLGYLRDAEVERHYRDARILGIGGGTTEIMNEIIAKGMGL